MPIAPSPLVDLLDLETLDVDMYRGRSPETSLQRVFGGQVAGQALVAAGRTVAPDRRVHSLHAYFIRPGDPSTPLIYLVDRARDGRSFTTRRVAARQHGRPIFVMSASFQVTEPGLDHQASMPPAPDPESLATVQERFLEAGERAAADRWKEWRSIDLRPVVPGPDVAVAGLAENWRGQVWMRAADRLPDEPMLHVCVLAYLSDLTLLPSALVPHGLSWTEPGLQMASLDHAMWFHRPFRADEWLLYDQFSPSATGGRGLATGNIFTRTGLLAASVVQEGLIRVRRLTTGS